MREHAGRGLEGSMYFEMYDPASATPENQAFVRKFRDRFGRQPDAWAAQGYDALHLLARAARNSGSANPLDLAYALRFMSPWEGAQWPLSFRRPGRDGRQTDLPEYVPQRRAGDDRDERRGARAGDPLSGRRLLSVQLRNHVRLNRRSIVQTFDNPVLVGAEGIHAKPMEDSEARFLGTFCRRGFSHMHLGACASLGPATTAKCYSRVRRAGNFSLWTRDAALSGLA